MGQRMLANSKDASISYTKPQTGVGTGSPGEAFDTGSKIRVIRSRKRGTLGTIRRDKHLILTVPKLVIVAQADSLIGRKTNYEITQDSLQLHAHNVMKSARKNIAI